MDTSEFSTAAFEFHRYLSDQVTPLMMVAQFGALLKSGAGAASGPGRLVALPFHGGWS